jgi:hypothetical protein
MERVRAAHRVRGAASNDASDPVGHIGRNMGERCRAFGTELVEEHVQRSVVAAGTSPHQVAAVMIDDHDQIAMPALVRDLIDPDPAQPVQPIDRRVHISVHARDDGADRAPRDAQQFHHRALRRSDR